MDYIFGYSYGWTMIMPIENDIDEIVKYLNQNNVKVKDVEKTYIYDTTTGDKIKDVLRFYCENDGIMIPMRVRTELGLWLIENHEYMAIERD